MDRAGVLICGAGGHGKVVADVVERAGRYSVRGFLDDRDLLWGTRVSGHPVIGGIEGFLDGNLRGFRFLVAVGDNAARERLACQILEQGGQFITAVHPSAQIGRGVEIDAGTVVMANAVINAGASIGAHVIVNTAATIDHDCLIEPFVHLGPGTHLAGHVWVGEGAQLGIGACAIPRVRIGRWACVGAGATVVRDLADGVTAVGTPAVPITVEKVRV